MSEGFIRKNKSSIRFFERKPWAQSPVESPKKERQRIGSACRYHEASQSPSRRVCEAEAAEGICDSASVLLQSLAGMNGAISLTLWPYSWLLFTVKLSVPQREGCVSGIHQEGTAYRPSELLCISGYGL